MKKSFVAIIVNNIYKKKNTKCPFLCSLYIYYIYKYMNIKNKIIK